MFLIISPGEETSKEASTSEDHHHFDQQLSGVLYLGLATLLWNFYQSHDKLLVRFLVNVVSLICVLRVVCKLFWPRQFSRGGGIFSGSTRTIRTKLCC